MNAPVYDGVHTRTPICDEPQRNRGQPQFQMPVLGQKELVPSSYFLADTWNRKRGRLPSNLLLSTGRLLSGSSFASAARCSGRGCSTVSGGIGLTELGVEVTFAALRVVLALSGATCMRSGGTHLGIAE